MRASYFLYRPFSAVDTVEPVWRQLERLDSLSFFLSWTWIGTWLRCLPAHIEPRLLIASRQGEHVGAAILIQRKERRRGLLNVRQLHFNTVGDPALDCITIEHNGFVGEHGSPELWRDFLFWFVNEGEADELVVPGLAEDGRAVRVDGTRLLHARADQPGFACDLPGNGMEAILANLTRNTRQQLRRNMRDCAQLGELRIESAKTLVEALAWFGELKRLHVRYWTGRGQQHAFFHPFWETFHRALIVAGVPQRIVRMRRISAGYHVLGYLYDFRWRERVYAYQSGFDMTYADLRPGYVAHVLAMVEDAREGMHTYDFLGGENQLKCSLGQQTYLLAQHRFARPTLALQLEAMAQSTAARLRARPKRRIPE